MLRDPPRMKRHMKYLPAPASGAAARRWRRWSGAPTEGTRLEPRRIGLLADEHKNDGHGRVNEQEGLVRGFVDRLFWSVCVECCEHWSPALEFRSTPGSLRIRSILIHIHSKYLRQCDSATRKVPRVLGFGFGTAAGRRRYVDHRGVHRDSSGESSNCSDSDDDIKRCP